MIRLLLMTLFFTSKVFANPYEPCMDANYSRILTVEYKETSATLTIKIKTVRPKEVFVKEHSFEDRLEIELLNSYISRERVFIGRYLELRDMGGWTRLKVKQGIKIITRKVRGGYLILKVSLSKK